MGQTIKRPFRSFNGTDWDTHYFDVSEDQIKTGFTQSFNTSSGSWKYKKLPGNVVMCIAGARGNSFLHESVSNANAYTMTLPFTFKYTPTAFISSQYPGGIPMITVSTVSTTKVKLLCNATASDLWVNVLVIGEVA